MISARRRAGVVRRRGGPDQQPAGLDAGGHLGQRVLDRLLPDQQVAVDLAGQRPVQAASRAACAMPDREGAHAGAEQVERAHRHREAAVDLAEHVVRDDPDAVEDEPADRVRGEHVETLAREARRRRRPPRTR